MPPRLSQALSVALFLAVVLGWWALTDQPLWSVVVVALVTGAVLTWATERSRRVGGPVRGRDESRSRTVGPGTTRTVGATTLLWAWGGGWGGGDGSHRGDDGGGGSGGSWGGGSGGGGGFDGGFGGGGDGGGGGW